MVPGKLGVLAKLLSPHRYTNPRFLRRYGGEIYGGEYRRSPELLERHGDALVPPSLRGYMYQLVAVSGWTSLRWLWTLKQPTLILHGTDDPIVPAVNATILCRLIRDA